MLEASIVSTRGRWGLESAHTALEMSGGAVRRSDIQQFETHFPAALAETADPIWMLAPFLETTFAREGSRVRLEESSPSFP